MDLSPICSLISRVPLNPYRGDFEHQSRVISGLIQRRSLLKPNRDELQLLQLRGLASHSIQQIWAPSPSPYTPRDFLAQSAFDTYCFKTPLRASLNPTTPNPSHSRGSKRKENEPLADVFPSLKRG